MSVSVCVSERERVCVLLSSCHAPSPTQEYLLALPSAVRENAISLPPPTATNQEKEKFEAAVYTQSLKIEPRSAEDKSQLLSAPRHFPDIRLLKPRRDVAGTGASLHKSKSGKSLDGSGAAGPAVGTAGRVRTDSTTSAASTIADQSRHDSNAFLASPRIRSVSGE